MKYRVMTEHAIEMLFALEKLQRIEDKPQRIDDICVYVDVNLHVASKIMEVLSRRGITSSRRGRGGGHFLERDLRDIRIGDVTDCFEEEIEIGKKGETSVYLRKLRRRLNDTLKPIRNAPLSSLRGKKKRS